MKRQIEICRKCHWFLDLKDRLDIYLCDMIMEVVTPSNRCKEWLKKDVPKSCPYRMEHQMVEWRNEEEN